MNVDVVVPAGGDLAHLDEALESIYGQTLQPMNVWVERDPGVPANVLRNRGLARATARAVARYVCFFDADDLMEPTKLEAQVAEAERTQADLVGSWRVGHAGRGPRSRDELLRALSRGPIGVQTSCYLWRRVACPPWDESRLWMQEVPQVLATLDHPWTRVSWVDQGLSVYRQGWSPQQTSALYGHRYAEGWAEMRQRARALLDPVSA